MFTTFNSLISILLAKAAKVPIAIAMQQVAMLSLTAKVKFLTLQILKMAAAWAATPIGIISIIAATAFGIATAVDSATKAFEKQEQVVQSLISEVQTLQTELDTLANKSNRTDDENQMLNILRAELAVKKELLGLEAEKAYKKYWWSSSRANGMFAEDAANAYLGGKKELSNLDRSDFSSNDDYIKEVEKIEELQTNRKDQMIKYAAEAAKELQLLQDIKDSGRELSTVDQQQYEYLTKVILKVNNLIEAEDGLADAGEVAADSQKSLTIALADLSAVNDTLSAVSKVAKDLADNGYAGIDNLSKLKEVEVFKNLPGIDDYIDKLSKANGNTAEASSILSDLTIAALDAQFSYEQLAAADETQIANLLKQNGIMNANEIATYSISRAKTALAIQTDIASGKTSDLIANLATEANAAGMTSVAFAVLAAKQITASNTKLSFSQQIAALHDLTEEAFGSAAAMASVFQTSVALKNYQEAVRRGDMTPEEAKSYAVNNAMDAFKELASSLVGTMPKVNYSTGNTNGNSTKETEKYVVETDKLYEAKKKVADIEDKISRIDKLSDATTDEKEQIALLNKKLALLKEQQEALHKLNELRRKEIQTDVDKLKNAGFIVTYDAANNDLLIENKEHLNEIVAGKGEDQKATNDLIKEYEKLIKKTEDSNEANKDASDQWLVLNKTIKETKKEVYSVVADQAKEAIDAYKRVIEREKDALEKLKEGYEERKSDIETTIDAVTTAIDKQKEALQEQNDELDKQLEIEEKLEAIEKAKDQRNSRILKEGEGFVWEADQSKISQAKEDYDELIRKNNIDAQIKKLEDYAEAWQDIIDNYEENSDKATANGLLTQLLGADWGGDLTKLDPSAIAKIASDFNKTSDQLNKNVEGSVEDQIENLDDLAKEWDDAYKAIEDVTNGYINDLSFLKGFEDANYKDRLLIIKNFVDEAILKLKQLQAEQAKAGQAIQGNPTTPSQPYSKTDNGAVGADGSKIVAVQSDGTAPAGLSKGDTVVSKDGKGAWTIADASTPGATYNPNSGYWSVKKFDEGGVVDYTGLAMVHGNSGKGFEMMLNNADAYKLYDYLHNSPSLITDMINSVAVGKLAPVNSNITPNLSKGMSFKVDTINLYDVQDVNSMAKAIVKEFPSKMRQALYKD